MDGMHERQLAIRVEQVAALDAVAMALALGEQDATWGTETLALAGGHLVLSGKGLYVNRAMAAGIEPALRDADLGLIVARSAAAGVTPAVDVTPLTHPESLAALTDHGFAPDQGGGTSVHTCDLTTLPDELTRPGIRIVPVGERSVADWQEVSALGWGHTTPAARRAADAFAAAAAVVDGDGMLLAYDADDGRPLGCASMTLHADVASLGGMSTIPAERGRGVQAALVLHRLGLARDAGCSIATSTTAVGGASERNVQRYGFHTIHVKHTWVRQ